MNGYLQRVLTRTIMTAVFLTLSGTAAAQYCDATTSVTCTETGTITDTPTETSTPSGTPTASETLTPSESLTPSETLTPSQTLTSSVTGTVTETPLPEATEVPLNLEQARVYPNAVTDFRPGVSRVTFDRLSPGTVIDIYTLGWNRVFSFGAGECAGGSAVWMFQNSAGSSVASGVYFCVLTDPNGNRKVKKVVLVR